MILMYAVNMNYEACGVAMFVSNALTGSIAFVLALIFILKMQNMKKYKDLFENKTELEMNTPQ